MFYCDLNPSFGEHIFTGKNFVDSSFIDTVKNYLKNQKLVKAEFSHNDSDKDLDSIRNSQIHWMTDAKYKDILIPLYQELATKIRQVNNNQWGLSIEGWEPFQYSEYDESYGGHYDWHIDYMMKQPNQPLSRKVSFSLGISDENDYEGGELLLKKDRNPRPFKLDRGEIIIFPSWMLHKVTPVTKGLRKVIVGWGIGPVV